MVTTILNWALFIFLASSFVILYIAYWVLIAERKEKNGSDIMIFICGCLAALMFVPSHNIFEGKSSVVIWKSLSALIGLSSLVVLLFDNKFKTRRKAHYWSTFFTMAVSIVPYVVNVTIEKSEPSKLFFYNNYSISPIALLGISVIYTLLITYLLLFIPINRIKKRQLEQSQLLTHLIENDTSINYTFRKPYERMLKEELLSMVGVIDKKLSDLLKVSVRKNTTTSADSSSDIKDINRIYGKIDELQKIMLLFYDKMPNERNNDFHILRDLNHFFATPFATIEANTELLKHTKGINEKYLDKIDNSIQLCRCVIETYREILSYSDNKGDIISSIRLMIDNAFRNYSERNNKNNLLLDSSKIPDKFLHLNNHYVISIVLPLLENAIQAAPDNTEIEVVFNIQSNTIQISNLCQETPNLSDLKTPGYSSKENHKGAGIIIVRNLLSIMNRGSLDTIVKDNKVIQIIKLNDNE